jgi:hypothetical protein
MVNTLSCCQTGKSSLQQTGQKHWRLSVNGAGNTFLIVVLGHAILNGELEMKPGDTVYTPALGRCTVVRVYKKTVTLGCYGHGLLENKLMVFCGQAKALCYKTAEEAKNELDRMLQ